MWQTLLTLVRYCLVGSINALVGIGVMIGFHFLGFNYVIYTLSGYIAGFMSSYTLNGLFTFKKDRLSYKELLLFVTLNGILLFVVESVQIIMINLFYIKELVGVAAGMVTYTIVGFLLNRRYVFKTV
jgi:putative flippase GtrA